MWSGEELILPSLPDMIEWIHSQLTLDSFDPHAMLSLARDGPLADRMYRELRGVYNYWMQWDVLMLRRQPAARGMQQAEAASYEQLAAQARQLARSLPPSVPLELFEAERTREEFASFVEHIHTVCVPQLRAHWCTAGHPTDASDD